MKKILQKHQNHWSQRYLVISSVVGVIFLTISLFISYIATQYATRIASNPVTDIVLSNVRVFDVDEIIIYGTIFFITLVLFILALQPHRIPFGTKSVGLFFLIRAVFISITHIGPFQSHVILGSRSILDFIGIGNTSDLFFSAHTGLPFLLALACWNNKYLRYLFLSSSLFGGTIVLLGHIHYSIDVLGALFITYTIFEITKYLFPRDYHGFIEQDI